MQLRMTINFIDYINRYISLINQICTLNEELKAQDDAEEIENICYKLDKITDGLFAEDVGAQIIVKYMSDIAKRAIELQDEKLIELLKGLDIIGEKEDTPNLNNTNDKGI